MKQLGTKKYGHNKNLKIKTMILVQITNNSPSFPMQWKNFWTVIRIQMTKTLNITKINEQMISKFLAYNKYNK